MAQQKYALVSGASSGIGFEVSKALAKKGYKVFGCSLEHTLWEMKPLQEYGVVPVACDISKVEDIKKAAQFIKEQTGGRLDILYNNAGISVGGPAIEIKDDDLERIFKVNVFGHIYMTKYMADFVIATKGSIIFTSSVAGKVPLSWCGAYCSTKAAIDQYALVLHGEMKPFGVRVHSVITGGVVTAIGDPLITDSMIDSRYDVPGIYDSLRAAARMSRDTNYSASRYANEVVAKITKRCDPGFNIYKGYRAVLLNFIRAYFPVWLMEYLIMFYFKQLKVFRGVKSRVALASKQKIE
ncbi:uncharacterized protein RJT20DRAFT_89991 [Scheffersomyces xylosifermentans]|uniref:uncharacterized protein n=1 Tax=Scheffersomyces xylosifermentans TaxID=1304137 RepID=UPI00315DD544